MKMHARTNVVIINLGPPTNDHAPLCTIYVKKEFNKRVAVELISAAYCAPRLSPLCAPQFLKVCRLVKCHNPRIAALFQGLRRFSNDYNAYVLRSENLWSNVALQAFTKRDWIENFRMSMTTFHYICDELRPELYRLIHTTEWQYQ